MLCCDVCEAFDAGRVIEHFSELLGFEEVKELDIPHVALHIDLQTDRNRADERVGAGGGGGGEDTDLHPNFVCAIVGVSPSCGAGHFEFLDSFQDTLEGVTAALSTALNRK